MSIDLSPLNGKKALVTAGAGKLGAEICLTLAGAGVDVAVNYRNSRDEAMALVDHITARFGGNHAAVGADVGVAEDVARMVNETRSALGAVDILINNAGPFSKTPFVDLAEEEWDTVLESNVTATYACSAAVAPGMREAGWGRIVNLSAVSAYVRNRSIYGLAKAAIHTLTESLALELGPEITVNAVAPGQIAESLDEMAGIDEDWARSVVDATPAGRLVTRAEVANLIVNLCLPTFDMVTGQVVAIDGGLRLPRF